MPAESTHLDYEGEIRGDHRQIRTAHPAGKILAAHRRLRLLQRRSVRDWQRHTLQWTCGQELQPHRGFARGWSRAARSRTARNSRSRRRLNGQIMQHATTEQMIHRIPRSSINLDFTTLEPGDVIVTGTRAESARAALLRCG